MDESFREKYKWDFLKGFLLTGVPTLVLSIVFWIAVRYNPLAFPRGNEGVAFLFYGGLLTPIPLVFLATLLIGLGFAFKRGTWAAWIGILVGIMTTLIFIGLQVQAFLRGKGIPW
jgi:hypothetical protein